MPEDEILSIKEKIVERLSPEKIYLFGSFADGTFRKDSDFDIYIVVNDSKTDWYNETLSAYQAIRSVRTRPVDILVGTSSDFEKRKKRPGIEQEVYQKGVLLYG